MGETGWDPELVEVVLTQLVADPFTKTGARLADVHRDVVNGSPGNPDQLALLGRGQLIVKAAQDALGRSRVIVLHEAHRCSD